ncbi:hypothetical protein ACFX13_033264 [Malus domestica]
MGLKGRQSGPKTVTGGAQICTVVEGKVRTRILSKTTVPMKLLIFLNLYCYFFLNFSPVLFDKNSKS